MEEALLLAAAFTTDKKTRIIVKKNRYQAQQLYQRLSPLLEDVLLFVMEDSLRVQAIASSPEDKEAMIHSLYTCLHDPKPRLIVCNTAAFLRYLPDVKRFREGCFHLQVDQSLDLDTFREKLIRGGYTKVRYVQDPCTFAWRGGIVDVYSLSYPHPVRIEFFDDQIESIRTFDVGTQRTVQSLTEIDLAPAGDLLFTEEQIESIETQCQQGLQKEQKRCKEEEFELLRDNIEKDLLALKQTDLQPHLYWYFSYVQAGSILDYTDGDILLSSQEEILRQKKDIQQESATFLQEMVQDKKTLPKYTMYHDLERMTKDRFVQSFHEFLVYDHPITSDIFPLEKATSSLLEQLQSLHGPVCFAVNEELKAKIQVLEGQLDYPYSFIEDDFYEGFQTPDFTVVTARELVVHSSVRSRYKQSFQQGQVLESVMELEKGDYIVHEEYGIGQYIGIDTRTHNNQTQDYLHILYAGNSDLRVPLSQLGLVRKYSSSQGAGIRLSRLGSDAWKKTKAKVNEQVEEVAARLIELYAKRSEHIGFAFSKDDALQREFEEAFEYEPTPDQLIACQQIKEEMEKDKPMDHLLCGDVGFGKTEVAMRCAFKAIKDGKQVAFLCPTTILSMQHYQTLVKRFEPTGAQIAVVNRFVSDTQIKEIAKGLKAGTIDIVVGTHRLLNKQFVYHDLGFLIIDEEQRFGVLHKEKIKEMKSSVDVLSLSATPIPRTLQMSLIGIRTISQLNTPPAQRHPIQTYVMETREGVIKEVIERELARDGQVFYLHNKVFDLYALANKIQHDFPDAKVGVVHGKMDKKEIEESMQAFSDKEYSILVCTTIIETGLDIPNANTIIIDDAERFGLSQLYQIRGRVGRREKLAYCYLMVQPQKQLSEAASKRLKSIKEFTQLGSGYKIAMRDLSIRGAGDLLGSQQAGFIEQVGLDLYLDLLSAAIARQQGKRVEQPDDKRAEISLQGYIPETFASDGDKISLYQEIKQAKTLRDLDAYEEKITDLFGHLPAQMKTLFERRRLDIYANAPYIDSIRETGKKITVTLSEEWSAQCDGVLLFETMNELDRSIQMRLVKGRIEIFLLKNNTSYDLLKQILQQIEQHGGKR
ncbi:MAG: transcription-repair coupling factor [Erysipelotrichaceae bacterium]|nr:transcription-repair coupling factor [Erysipelotrichaceae bacterium]